MSEGSYQVFQYQKPSDMPGGKAIVQLAGSDIIRGRVQVVREGGENNLHSHRGMDGFWMVLAGRVRFYGPGDVVIGEFGKHEGVLIPGVSSIGSRVPLMTKSLRYCRWRVSRRVQR